MQGRQQNSKLMVVVTSRFNCSCWALLGITRMKTLHITWSCFVALKLLKLSNEQRTLILSIWKTIAGML